MLIDTHCHLNFKAFNKDLEVVIKNANLKNIDKIIIPGAKLSSSEKAVSISEKFNNCFAAVGIHPHHINEFNNLGRDKVTNRLDLLAKNEKVVAVGEAGMDYYRYRDYPEISDSDKKIQKELLILQCEIAVKNNLPVIIHCREAQNDLLDILTSFMKNSGFKLSGVFHCFDGENDYLGKVISLGFYVGFDGNITYEENNRLRENIAYAPLDRILIETDAPFLTPIPYRGSRNEPAYLEYTAQLVAQIKKTDRTKIGEATSNNALTLFRLKKEN